MSSKGSIPFSRAGLVCSGGATKAAAFHVGVCLALRDKGFSFIGGKSDSSAAPSSVAFPPPKFHPHQISTYVGSSAGALIVAMLASGISIETIINTFSTESGFKLPSAAPELPKLSYRDMLRVHVPSPKNIWTSFKKSGLLGRTFESLLLKNLRLPGIFSTKGLAEWLQKMLPTENFHELQADLFIIGTQLDHSRKIIFGRHGTEKSADGYSQYASNANISDAVAASMSLPPIFVPYLVEHKGAKPRYYIDGEIRETLSTDVAKENGCDLLICSYTHQPYHFREDTGSLIDYGMPAIAIQALYQMIEQKIYASRRTHEYKRQALETVREVFKEKNLDSSALDELCTRLKERLDFRENLNYLFIHPEAKDKEMFFGDHFTLNSETLQKVVTIGYRRAMAELRKVNLEPITT